MWLKKKERNSLRLTCKCFMPLLYFLSYRNALFTPTKPQTLSGNWWLCFSRTFTWAHLQRDVACVILSCHILRHPQRGTKKTHYRIVYRAICTAWHKVCLHSVAACQRCHTSTGNKAHGDKAQFIISVTSVVTKGRKKLHCAPSSPIHWLPLASHSIHTPSWLFILGSRLNSFTNAKKNAGPQTSDGSNESFH